MARALTKEVLLNNAAFINSAEKLYNGNLKNVCERYSALTEGLNDNVMFFSSPGRAELVGNHTDHNHGLVIAGSIDLDVVAAVNKTDDDVITIKSDGYDPFSVNVNDLPIEEKMYGTSTALLRGIVKGFLDRGYAVGGFTANADSNIFKGAGVSSSAAFELLLCEILNVLYNDGKIDATEKAIISRFSENVYFGKPSGLMDQLTISRGNVSFMNFGTEIPTSETVEWKFDNLSLVIINCGGDHCNLTEEYAAIRTEMESIAEFFNKPVLGEVPAEKIYSSLPELKQRFCGRAILRALHFAEENERVKITATAIAEENGEKFLEMITASGLSSALLLQNLYPSGDVEQNVPLALAIIKRDKDTLACRVHGGGFAGTVLSFVRSSDSDSYVSRMKQIFGEENVFGVKIRKYGAIRVF